jgi:biotin carboxyl carrier protein
VKFFVTVEAREFVVEVDGERLRIDGREFRGHLSPVPGTPLRHLLLDDASLTLMMDSPAAGAWDIGVHGAHYCAEAVDERTRHIRTLTGAAATAGAARPLRAPMPGLVVRVLVAPGQVAEPGQGLVVLEAMKMENELRATARGMVTAVAVVPGQAVEKGMVLLEFGPAEAGGGEERVP